MNDITLQRNMSNCMHRNARIMARLALVVSMLAANVRAEATEAVAKADSTVRSVSTELTGVMQRRMVQSAFPVTVTMRGNAICVRSKYNQLLPVYTQNGVFYAAFRLTKGTNWLSGLPRGTYIINNQRVTVS